MVIYFCFIEKCTETQVKQLTNVVPSNTSMTGVRRVIIRTNGISKKEVGKIFLENIGKHWGGKKAVKNYSQRSEKNGQSRSLIFGWLYLWWDLQVQKRFLRSFTELLIVS